MLQIPQWLMTRAYPQSRRVWARRRRNRTPRPARWPTRDPNSNSSRRRPGRAASSWKNTSRSCPSCYPPISWARTPGARFVCELRNYSRADVRDGFGLLFLFVSEPCLDPGASCRVHFPLEEEAERGSSWRRLERQSRAQ